MEPLPKYGQVAYAIGQLGWSTLINILGLQLVYFYLPPEEAKMTALITQQKFFIILNAITLIASGGRLIEFFTDPYIAGKSDTFSSKFGRRIPFMAIGCLPSALFCCLMFWPPDSSPTTINLVWIIVMQLLFYVSFSFYVMPHNALLIELGHNEHERLNLSTWISLTYALGIVAAAAGTSLWEPIMNQFNVPKTTAIQYSVCIIAAFAFLCMLVPVFVINEKKYTISNPSNQPIFESLKRTFRNPLFRIFLLSDAAYWMGLTIIETGLVYYVTVLLHLPESIIFPMLAGMIVTSFLLYPVVNMLARRFSRKSLILTAFLVFAGLFCLICGLGYYPLPQVVQGMIVMVLAGFPVAFLGILPNTILADIAELDTLETGNSAEGMYFAARTMLMKLAQTGGIIVFAALLTLGKDASNSIGIRLTGVAGFLMCAIAYWIFRFYNERKISEKINKLRNVGRV